jgi:uncharacterized protein YndB with AHSA1/START domain
MRVFDERANGARPNQENPASPERWRGPKGYTLLSWQVDFRPGRACRLHVRSPEGRECWAGGVFLEIVEPERIVFSGRLEAGHEPLTRTPAPVTFRRV